MDTHIVPAASGTDISLSLVVLILFISGSVNILFVKVSSVVFVTTVSVTSGKVRDDLILE